MSELVDEIIREMNHTKKTPFINALTIDLEDWYHICGDGEYSDPARWDEYENRVTRNTEKILALLNEANCKATFFVLGYLAEKNPGLIRKLADEGHELAVHGYYHRRVFEMSRAEFCEDLKRSINVIEQASGKKVMGFRAPEWSIRDGATWALDAIKECGLKYDSSMVPMTGMGDRNYLPLPHVIDTNYGKLHEFPLTTFRCFGERLPFTGGLPMRIAPYFFIVNSIKRLNNSGNPAILYVHPWEFDDVRPTIKLPLSRRFMHYFNIRSTKPKFEGLLKHFRFAPVSEVLGINQQEKN